MPLMVRTSRAFVGGDDADLVSDAHAQILAEPAPMTASVPAMRKLPDVIFRGRSMMRTNRSGVDAAQSDRSGGLAAGGEGGAGHDGETASYAGDLLDVAQHLRPLVDRPHPLGRFRYGWRGRRLGRHQP